MRAFLSLLLTLTMGLPLTACSSDGVISSRLPSEGTAPVEKAPAETVQLIGATAATAAADSSNQQILYLWEELPQPLRNAQRILLADILTIRISAPI